MAQLANIKQELLSACQIRVNQTITGAEKELENFRVAAGQETKSSAGDKYETSREMLQQEMNKVVVQLDNAIMLRKTLDLINPNKSSSEIQLGSLVNTNQSNFFISISLGKLELHGKFYYAVSAVSPIAQAMLGLRAKDIFEFNSQQIEIRQVE